MLCAFICIMVPLCHSVQSLTLLAHGFLLDDIVIAVHLAEVCKVFVQCNPSSFKNRLGEGKQRKSALSLSSQQSPCDDHKRMSYRKLSISCGRELRPEVPFSQALRGVHCHSTSYESVPQIIDKNTQGYTL